MRLANKKATLQILSSNRPPNKAKLYLVSRKQSQNKQKRKLWSGLEATNLSKYKEINTIALGSASQGKSWIQDCSET